MPAAKRSVAAPAELRTLALRKAAAAGLTSGPKSRHINAKVPPALFDAAAKRLGDTSPAAVITAALASLANDDDLALGPWLAANRGILADIDEDVWEQIRF